MATAWTPLGKVTLTATSTSIVFSSIPSTYRDLRVVIQAGNDASSGVKLNLNSDTTSSYPTTILRNGTGSPVSSTSTNAYATIGANVYSTNALTLTYVIDILDYSQTDKHKPILVRGNNAATSTEFIINRWASIAAVNTVTIAPLSGNLISGSTVSLFGIAG
jgi:hypothetical protein